MRPLKSVGVLFLTDSGAHSPLVLSWPLCLGPVLSVKPSASGLCAPISSFLEIS